MAKRDSIDGMFRGPCSNCEHLATCQPYRELEQHLFSRREFQKEPTLSLMDEALDQITSSFLESLRGLHAQGRLQQADLGYALSALVDYCITGVYTNGLVTEDATFSQVALRCGHSRAVFPYTWMCPICVSEEMHRGDCYLPGARRDRNKGIVRDYPDVARLAKPGGRAIGDQGIQVIKSLLRETISKSGTGARLRDGGGARGEFDLTIATDATLTFIEVKAKPLISFPLVAELAGQAHSAEGGHQWVNLNDLAVDQLSLYLAANKELLPLSIPNIGSVKVWPLEDLAALAKDVDTVANIVSTWAEHAKSYEEQWGEEADRLRWHRFGCGNFHISEPDGTRVEKRVANTKELPGLDRTDDIKKGAAQVLKYSRLKFQCKKRALRSVLLGNTHALTHHQDYVAPILRLKVINADDPSSQAEWIFDAMVGLTKNHFNDPQLEDIFGFNRILSDRDPAIID